MDLFAFFYFDGIDSCLTEVVLGRDSVLVFDSVYKHTVKEHSVDMLPTGIYGMSARHAQEKSLARIDFMYNGQENCLMKCLAGQDSLLICDSEMVECAKRSVDFINGAGYGNIEIRTL